MCVGQSLGGALMEKFDDSWGPAGDDSRSLTEQQLNETWETLIYLPPVTLFDCGGPNHLSKIGMDAQMYTGEYAGTQVWAMRMMSHPHMIDGIVFPSRHDPTRQNIALFKRLALATPHHDPTLTIANLPGWTPDAAHSADLIYGPMQILATHPELDATLVDLEVSRVSP